MQYFILALKKYAVFSGRSRRAEYWYFVLFSTLIGIGVGTLDVFIYGLESDAFVTPSLFISLAMMVPSIAVGARRLHDVDKSGWWMLLWFIFIIGWIPLFVWAVRAGTTGPNRFGDDPKQEEYGTEESANPDPPHPHLDIPESDPT